MINPVEIVLDETTIINLTLRAKIAGGSISQIISDAIREYSTNHPVSNDDLQALTQDMAKEEVVMLAALKSIQNLSPDTIMDSQATIAFYRMLDDAFGESWHPNDDPQSTGDLNFRPIDVVAPIDAHPSLINAATKIETRMRQEFNVRVLIFVLDEATTCND